MRSFGIFLSIIRSESCVDIEEIFSVVLVQPKIKDFSNSVSECHSSQENREHEKECGSSALRTVKRRTNKEVENQSQNHSVHIYNKILRLMEGFENEETKESSQCQVQNASDRSTHLPKETVRKSVGGKHEKQDDEVSKKDLCQRGCPSGVFFINHRCEKHVGYVRCQCRQKDRQRNNAQKEGMSVCLDANSKFIFYHITRRKRFSNNAPTEEKNYSQNYSSNKPRSKSNKEPRENRRERDIGLIEIFHVCFYFQYIVKEWGRRMQINVKCLPRGDGDPVLTFFKKNTMSH